MKTFIILVLSVFAFAFTSDAQSQPEYHYRVFTVDTLTNADTLTFTETNRFYPDGTLEYHFAADSISGTPAGTIYYEYALDPAGTEWYVASTDTITNAASTDQQHKVTNFTGTRARIRVISTGTLSVECSPSIAFKRAR